MKQLQISLCLLAGTVLAVSCGGTGGSEEPSRDIDLLAAGDVAQCNGSLSSALASSAKSTADLASRAEYASLPILALGDLAYSTGSTAEFANCYEPTWGSLKSRTYPVPGNHEYGTANAQGYLAYFGAQAIPQGKTYYSFNLGTWHIIALDSNLAMQSGSAQEQWLRQDLTANANTRCVLAYWHHPRFASATNHPSDAHSQDVWQALIDFKADLVLSGHNHHYERFEPMTANGSLDAKGVRSFVVGTGGASLYGFGTPQVGSAYRQNTAYGFLKLTLKPQGYDWGFASTGSNTLIDQGSASCVD